MAETIYINKKSKQKELERVKVEINKAIRETTKSLTKDINTLNDEYSNMLSTFEVFVQQTNDAIASMEAEIEELKKEEYSKGYFTFEALEPTDITLSYKSSQNKSIEYSFDKSTWTTFTPASGAETIASLNAGDKMYVRGAWTNNQGQQSFGSTGRYKVSGNIMSLFYGDNFVDKTAFGGSMACLKLFYESTLLTDASNLVIPATTLANYCYNQMFYGCTSLVAVPALPATTLATECYGNMFAGCTSLTTAPELPATTLADSCYYLMFAGCTSLTTAPELPATTLTPECYRQMFGSCTSLTTAPELPATTLARNCYANMFYSCTSLTTAPELPATTLVQNCYYQMFKSCTSLKTAPDLNATTLELGCYRSMFDGCARLNYVKCLATTNINTNTINFWLSGAATTGTFVKDANTTWPSGANGIPTAWTVVNV